MTTVGELMDALQGYNRNARVCVLVDTAAASDMVFFAKEDTEYYIDNVQPIGCNLFDVKLTIGGAR